MAKSRTTPVPAPAGARRTAHPEVAGSCSEAWGKETLVGRGGMNANAATLDGLGKSTLQLTDLGAHAP